MGGASSKTRPLISRPHPRFLGVERKVDQDTRTESTREDGVPRRRRHSVPSEIEGGPCRHGRNCKSGESPQKGTAGLRDCITRGPRGPVCLGGPTHRRRCGRTPQDWRREPDAHGLATRRGTPCAAGPSEGVRPAIVYRGFWRRRRGGDVKRVCSSCDESRGFARSCWGRRVVCRVRTGGGMHAEESNNGSRLATAWNRSVPL